MNIKLRRTARTSHSEEIAIFDADSRDETGEAAHIGKLDVHYVDDQIVGTLLIWAEYVTAFNRTRGPGAEESMTDVIDEILAEISEPLGVAAEYGIEVYYPRLDQHEFVANYDEDEEDELDGVEYPEGENGLTDDREPRIH